MILYEVTFYYVTLSVSLIVTADSLLVCINSNNMYS